MSPPRFAAILGSAGALILMVAGCGGGATRSAPAPPTVTKTTLTETFGEIVPAASPHRRRASARPRALPDPTAGRLSQTSAIPSSHTATFRAEMRALWDGIRTGTPGPAMPAFFPEAAYAQLKAIGDPQSDWQARLVGDYALDIVAAHAVLGAGARTARLIGVDVPAAGVKYVPPEICENRFGYEEVPNSRIVYSRGGAVRSIGIASLISWRGIWYVVHLGAVDRSADVGIVDDASDGAGISAPSTTC